jgi:hypothetical protein
VRGQLRGPQGQISEAAGNRSAEAVTAARVAIPQVRE